jgi:PIN domain nuclease of toxin-antitoxin system
LILLDTNVLVWLIMGDPRLKPQSRFLVEETRSASGVQVSPISAWEISMLVDKGRLELGTEVSIWVQTVFSAAGIHPAPLTPSLAVDAGRLPGSIHGDPADRLIIATARDLACPLLTTDRKILAYGKQGHVQVVDAHL